MTATDGAEFPCLAYRMKMELHDRRQFDDLIKNFNEQYIKYRLKELRLLDVKAKQIAPNYAITFRSIMSDAFNDLGFGLDRLRSREDFPVLSKTINAAWDICWSPESNRTLQQQPIQRPYDFRHRSTLDLRCYVRSQRNKTFPYIPIGFNELDIMQIRVQNMVEGFAGAYIGFNGTDELLLIINAHAALYRIIQTELEFILREELGGDVY